MDNSVQTKNDQFLLLQTLTRESAAMRQRVISYFQFYMSVQIAMGGLFALIIVNIPEEPDELREWVAVYICAIGIAIAIGGFAYGAFWLSPKKINDNWILRGLSQIGNTHDLEAWNIVFREHLESIEIANSNLRKHLHQVRKLVLVEVIILIICFILAMIVTA